VGTYRLLLAICVLLSHAGIVLFGHNQGASAVISFFLLSGFVMTALIRKNYDSKGQIKKFYLDRVLRLFPQFIVYLVATLIFASITNHPSPFLEELSGLKVVMNALMLPLSLYMLGLEKSLLLPQAWSLGLELTFYISIPFILLCRLERYAFVLSLCVFGLAYFGVIDTDSFGYRLLPGTLFIFLLGSFLYERKGAERIYFIVATYVIALVAFLWVLRDSDFMRPNNFEVLLGILVGLPIVAGLIRLPRGKIDEVLGNISYGVFLNHFLLIWIFQALRIEFYTTRAIVTLIAISIALGWFTYNLVEKPVLIVRRHLRSARVGRASSSSVQQSG
jgi:peptidoglycan/LPS O-acetylase OafA/YrhL